MHNPFVRPHTPWKWLLSSVCWVLACVSGWLPIAFLFSDGHLHSITADGITIGGFWLAHSVIWRRALRGWDPFLRLPQAQFSVLGVLGSTWIAFLILFQVATLLIGVAWTLLTILFFCHNCID